MSIKSKMSGFKLNQKELNNIVNQYNLPIGTFDCVKNTKENILISGATGYLATHLISYLMLDVRIKNIYLLVRNKEKFIQNLNNLGLIKNQEFTSSFLNTLSLNDIHIEKCNFNKLLSKKVHFILGDVSEKNWNINFQQIGHAIDLIIHCAAKISALDLLKHNKKDNCDSTFYGIELAQKFNASFMLASTLSVFVSSSQYQGVFYESDNLNQEKDYFGGYAQSKYISEKLAQQYPSQIIRYGLLTGSTFSGKFPFNSFFELFVKWIEKNKVLPKQYEESFVDITPVDIAALITKELIFKGNFSFNNNIYHIANSKSVSLTEIINSFIQKDEIKWLEHDDFVLYLKQFKKFEQIFFYYAFFKTKAIKIYPQYFNIDLFQSTLCTYDKHNLKNLNLDLVLPINKELLNLYIEAFHE